jgi:peptidoglycan/LPS O-acetylase OafA/YrhL
MYRVMGSVLLPKRDIAPLTGLRFVAAFCILFMHTTFWCAPFTHNQASHAIGDIIGVYGMPLFFVLSGFVIHYNYGTLFRNQTYRSALRQFLSARFARIYPLYLFFCIFGALSDFTADWIGYAPRTFLSNIIHSVTLTQSWVYKIVVNDRVLLDNGFGLGWSISTEFFFYLCYTIFVFAILFIRRPATNLVIAVLFSVLVFTVLGLGYSYSDRLMTFARAHVTHYIDLRDNFSNSLYRWLFYYSPYSRVWEFVLGCLSAQLFLLVQHRSISDKERAFGSVTVYLSLLILFVFGILYGLLTQNTAFSRILHFFALNFGCAVPIATLIFCLARYQTPVSQLLSLPPILWLGDISYSIYAVHTWTVRPFIRPAIELNSVYAIDAVLRVSTAIAFTIIAATATYRIIELPCRRYLRNKLMGAPVTRSQRLQSASPPIAAREAGAPV